MALHTELPIYKVAYDLLGITTDLVRNMPRDFKQSIGVKLRDECVEIVVLIFKANCAMEKTTYLDLLIERLQVSELLLRLSRDKRLISTQGYAQAIERGVDFVGQVIKPWHRSTRRRTVHEAIRRVSEVGDEKLLETANSYFGLLRQASASHHDRARLANVLRRRGYSIKGDLSKTFRKMKP